jgi:hypothetical protein
LPEGIKTAVVDYTDSNSVAKELKEHNVQVVISTLSHNALLQQKSLADAAKKAGVKLFAPSEFGAPKAPRIVRKALEKSPDSEIFVGEVQKEEVTGKLSI